MADGRERQPLLSQSPTHDGWEGTGPFGVTDTLLADLVSDKDVEGLQRLGGMPQLLEHIRVDPATGLRASENLGGHQGRVKKPFAARRKYFGENVLPTVESASFLSLVLDAYNDRTLVMLSIAALVSLVVGVYEDYYEAGLEANREVVLGTAILVAVFVVVMTNAINDYQKEKQFRKLNAKKEDRCVKVFRDGTEEVISVYDVNVGDILLLEPGEIVAVDGIYLEGHNLVCDESSATGESDAIKKGTPESGKDCFILSGSKVLEGVARIVVVAVGEQSFYGKTMMAMRETTDQETPLQKKLDRLAENIGKLGLSVAILMLICLVIKYFITVAVNDQLPPADELLSAMIQIVIQAITIVVVAVPEGLPMAVTLALAYATTQMIKDGNLVRVLSACETMGNATTVCSDKTGTLTQNKMTVTDALLATRAKPEDESVKNLVMDLPQSVRDVLYQAVACNSTAFESTDEKGQLCFIGSKTESALLEMIKLCGIDYKDARNSCPVEHVYPFASEKKSMTTVVRNPRVTDESARGAFRVHCKGASEIVVGYCTHYLDNDGNVQALTKTVQKQIDETIACFADGALRTICLAYRDVTAKEAKEFTEDRAPNSSLVCIGVVGIEDPLRPGIIESVRLCQRAGVVVRMITGDNLRTAMAIAKKAGIYFESGETITGPEWRALSDEQRTELIPKLQVLARSSPTDKQIVVKTLQKLDEIVAMTGDGTNDGPALKMADVGFSMGIAGTEVAKEASEIILMDDNFVSIVKALRWGRAVNDSVRRFLQFQLTVNVTAVLLAFISAMTSEDNASILTTVQLLWVNLIMDTLAALALATEPPTDELLKRYPGRRDAPLINARMWKMIIGQAIFQVVINLLLISHGKEILHLPSGEAGTALLRTIVFNTFVFLQVFNEINCRRIDDTMNVFENITHSHMFLIVQVIVIAGQILIVEFGGIAFGTVPLSPAYWVFTIVVGSLSLPVGFLLRLMPNYTTLLGIHAVREDRRPTLRPSEARFRQVANRIKTQSNVFRALRGPVAKKPRSRMSFADVAVRVQQQAAEGRRTVRNHTL